ncbi:MAG TPA: hypothetical protein DCS24_08860 [Erythrobacter sp.]|nr:hypothetical protein [Erythrobacter sp.]
MVLSTYSDMMARRRQPQSNQPIEDYFVRMASAVPCACEYANAVEVYSFRHAKHVNVVVFAPAEYRPESRRLARATEVSRVTVIDTGSNRTMCLYYEHQHYQLMQRIDGGKADDSTRRFISSITAAWSEERTEQLAAFVVVFDLAQAPQGCDFVSLVIYARAWTGQSSLSGTIESFEMVEPNFNKET